MPNVWNGTMFGDLDWPLNMSRGFVSIIWASCFEINIAHEKIPAGAILATPPVRRIRVYEHKPMHLIVVHRFLIVAHLINFSSMKWPYKVASSFAASLSDTVYCCSEVQDKVHIYNVSLIVIMLCRHVCYCMFYIVSAV